MKLTTRRIPSYKIVERHAGEAVRHALPTYVEAVSAVLRGEDATEAWIAYERALVRAWVLLSLLGEANARRSMKLPPVEDQRPLTEPDVSLFALDIGGLFHGGFVAAINAFLKDVPDLQDRVTVILETAKSGARAFRKKEMQEAPRSLTKTLASHIAKRMDEGDVDTLLEPRAIAQALQTASGRQVAVNRMETQYRTALLSAFNEGQREQRSMHADLIPLQELNEIQDRRTRGNPAGLYPDAGPHYQMHGFVAPVADPIWNIITPPNGYNCRATTRGIGWPEARRRGWAEGRELNLDALRRDMKSRQRLIDSGSYPDPGFRGTVRPLQLT